MRPCIAWVLLALGACNSHREREDKHATEHHEAPAQQPPDSQQLPDSPPAAAFRAYATATTCEAREKLIAFPEHNHDALRASGCSAWTISSIDDRGCAPDGGTTCSLSAAVNGTTKSAWLVRQPGDAFLIDFRATELPQPTFATVMAQRPTKPVLLRGWASLATHHESSATRGTHQPIELSDPSMTSMSTRIFVYLAKSRPDAKDILAIVENTHLWHPLTVTLHYQAAADGTVIAILDSLIAPSFYETAREHAFDSAATR